MPYPGDPFREQSIPTRYKKAHPPIPKVKDCQSLIAKHADTLHVFNNDVITEDFYTKAIEIKTDRSKTHFQSILRHPSSNIIYLSGSDATNDASQLFVVEVDQDFGEGDKHKKTLVKGPLGSNTVFGKPDKSKDRLIKIYKIDGTLWHGGGMDTEGDILVIPLENADISPKLSSVQFFCIKDALHPIPFKTASINRTGEIAGAAGLIRLKNGRYLCGVWVDSDEKGHRLDLYLSRTTDIADGFFEDSEMQHYSLLWKSNDWVTPNNERKRQRNFQNIQFFRDKEGGIFIYAVDNKFKTSPLTPGLNRIHLLRLDIDEAALDGDDPTFVNPRIIQFPEMKINNVKKRYCFAAGGSFYITPENNLALYSVAHWRDSQDRISMGEFYPPLMDTGQTIKDIELSRVELYDDKNFGMNSSTALYMKRCLKIIGTNNNVLEDFKAIQVQGKNFGDKVHSLKMILPKGYSLWLYEHDNFKGKRLEIKGTGKFHEIKKIEKVGGKVSSLRIVKQ